VLRPLPGIRRKVYAYLPAERQEKQSCKIFLDILCGIHAKSASDA
jgi:hypothetical protein